MMVEKGNVKSEKSQERMSPEQMERRVMSWTLPTVDLHSILSIEEGSLNPVPYDKLVEPIAEVARIRADTQNHLGIKVGYYPPGFVTKDGYSYKPEDRNQARARRYSPRIAQPPEQVMKNYFPQTYGVKDFAEAMSNNKQGFLTEEEIRSAELWVSIGKKIFSNEKRYHGKRRINSIAGIPVIFFENQEDLMNFEPFNDFVIPDNTSTISFILLHSQIEDKDDSKPQSPVVASHSSSSRSEIYQHIRSITTFTEVVDTNLAIPILVSKTTPDLESHLKSRIKDRLLEILISKKEGVHPKWFISDESREHIDQVNEELFDKEKAGDNRGSFYIDQWPNVRRDYGGIEYKERISSFVEAEMEKALYALGRASTISQSRELLLAKVNYFSFFSLSDWNGASELFNQWDNKFQYLRSFGIPLTR